jgi:hypothetical protein
LGYQGGPGFPRIIGAGCYQFANGAGGECCVDFYSLRQTS